MKKNIIFMILIFVLSIIMGICGYSIYSNIKDKNDTYIAEKINDIQNNSEKSIITDASEEKVSVNTKFKYEVYYKKCDHEEVTYEDKNENYINLSEEELAKQFPDWNIIKFSNDEVILRKEVQNVCPKHYIIREQEGLITVYHIINDEELLYKVTDIATEYLTDKDIQKIRDGIYVYGDDELNATLEDFE